MCAESLQNPIDFLLNEKYNGYMLMGRRIRNGKDGETQD